MSKPVVYLMWFVLFLLIMKSVRSLEKWFDENPPKEKKKPVTKSRRLKGIPYQEKRNRSSIQHNNKMSRGQRRHNESSRR